MYMNMEVLTVLWHPCCCCVVLGRVAASSWPVRTDPMSREMTLSANWLQVCMYVCVYVCMYVCMYMYIQYMYIICINVLRMLSYACNSYCI